MNRDIDKKLKPYLNIGWMLKSVHAELWDIFLPESKDDLYKLELNIVKMKKLEYERNQVMAIQRRYGFPLRPNSPLREMIVKVKIHRLKLERQGRPRRDFD